MPFSKYTNYTITSPNYSSRGGRAINGWIIHHNATTNGDYVLALMHTGAKEVSANYEIRSNGDAVGVVDEAYRSWSVANAAWDGSSVTFETENTTGGPSWGISDASMKKIALIIADNSTRYNIPINSTTVRGHNQGSAQGAGGSYSTACPGPSMNIAYIIQLAQGYKTAGGGTTPIEEDDMYSDNDRARDNLSNQAIGRIEQHVYSIHKTIDELRFVIIGNDAGTVKLNKQLSDIQADVDKIVADLPK